MTTPCNARLLLIETSGAVGHVGLAASGALLAEAILDRGRQHTRDLIPQCQRLCEQAGWKPTDLEAIVVSAGPGSYTGLRVGIMTAKTLAYALNKPLVSVPTFEVIARQCFREHPTLTSLQVVADGQQDRVYVQEFSNRWGDRQSSDDFGTLGEFRYRALSIMKGADWRSTLTAGTSIAGPGLRQQLALLPTGMNVLPEACWDPQLSALLQSGMDSLNSGNVADPFSLEPLYLRASSAEEQWAAMGK